MTESESNVIQVPTWFLKLSGWGVGIFAASAFAWAAWLTVSVVEIKASVDTHDKNAMKIDALQKDVNDLRIEMIKSKK